MFKLCNNGINIQFVSICFLIFYQLIFQGCATRQVILDRAIVQNDTARIITEVKVLHEPTGKTGSVNMILPQSSFELGFAGAPMQGKRGIITWTDHVGRQRKIELSLPRGPATGEGRAMMSLIYTIRPSGEVTVELK
jgi:hypothetical protein